jgi:hypothetical protein
MTRVVLVVLLLVPYASSACFVDEDCSLNGLCVGKACQCDAGWVGADCGVLDLQPAVLGCGYNRTSNGTSSWGGTVVRDAVDSSLWHLIVCEFTHDCGLDYWAPFSRIVRAESRVGPAGPFAFAAEVVPMYATNPTVTFSEAAGLFLLYHIGCPYPQPPPTCSSPDFACGSGDAINGESGVSLHTSPDLSTWTPAGMVFNGSTVPGAWDADTSNPSPLVLPNGSVVLAYRGCLEDCSDARETELIGIVAGPSPTGPFLRSSITPGGGPVLPNHPNEDPHVWRDARGGWHLLMHSLEADGGWGSGPRVGRHAFARSAAGPWTFGNTSLAYNTTVAFTDGSVRVYHRRERPQLLWEGGRPVLLTTGVQEVGSAQSYTLCQPIGPGGTA